jgi:hypothetical protein
VMLFDWFEFKRRWGLAGVRGHRAYGAWEHEYDYGIGQKLTRHKYLQPFHTARYGTGTVLKDGAVAVLWHQWYGSYRTRFANARSSGDPAVDQLVAYATQGEEAFLADYPNLDLSRLHPAWGPEWDIRAEQHAAELAYPGVASRIAARVRRSREEGLRRLVARLRSKVDRWRLERS